MARRGGERSFYAPRRRAPHEGREGVSNCASDSHFETPTLVTISPAAGPQRSRGAGLGLEVTERVPSGDLEPQPRKQTPTHHTPSVFLFFCLMGPGATESLFLQARGGPPVVTSWCLMTSRLATGG